jgi:hypothetical protein
MLECYMCSAFATTMEHVPPKCFFPERLRANLITVPSCITHNLNNSLDVEYVRNVLATQHGTNVAAAEVFETVKRSYDRSPKLASQTFGAGRTVVIEGEETGACPIDLARHKRIMSAIALLSTSAITRENITATGGFSRQACNSPKRSMTANQTLELAFGNIWNPATISRCQHRTPKCSTTP